MGTATTLAAGKTGNNKYGLTRGNRLVKVGHSFAINSAESTFGTSTPTNSSAYGGNALSYSKIIFERAQIILNHPFNVVASLAVSGETSTQTLAKFSQAVSLMPDWIYLDCHSNDFVNSISVDTTISNTLAMLNMAAAANIQVILALDIPRTGFTAQNMRDFMKLNNYFEDYGHKNSGVIVFNQFPYFLDTSSVTAAQNGTPLSSVYLSDLIHPNSYGAGLAAQGLANLLRPHVVVSRRLAEMHSDGGTNGDQQIISRNPLTLGTGGAAGTGASGTFCQNSFCARNSGSGISVVGSLVSRASIAATFPNLFDDGIQGQVQALALSGASSASELIYFTLNYASNAAFAALAGTGPYVLEAEVGVNMTSGTVSNCYLSAVNAVTPSGQWLHTVNYIADAGDTINLSKFYGVLRSRQFYLPSNIDAANNSYIGFFVGTSTGATGTAYITNFALRKVLV